ERAGDLALAARAIRSGEAIGAVYVPADFERDLKAERRPQVVAFYNQQFLTAAGIASSGLSDSLTAAVSRAVTPPPPHPARIGSLVAETIVLVNPEKNYAQFLLRTLLPMVIHVAPVFHCSAPDKDPLIIGCVSAYHANRATGEALPGLLRAQDVSHFHAAAGR